MTQKYCAQKLWGIWFILAQTLQKDKCSQKQSQRVHLSKRDKLQQLKITNFYLQISTLEDDYDNVRSCSNRFWFCQNQFSFCWFTVGISMIHQYFQTCYGTPELFVEKKFLICLVPSAIKIVICLFKWLWTNVQSVLFHLLTIESIKRSSWPSWEKIQTHAIKPLVSPKFVMDLTFLQISRNSFCALEAWWCFQLNW